jgi:hypothetical protein
MTFSITVKEISTQHNDIQHNNLINVIFSINDIQHSNKRNFYSAFSITVKEISTQHNDIQHNIKRNIILSIMTFGITINEMSR